MPALWRRPPAVGVDDHHCHVASDVAVGVYRPAVLVRRAPGDPMLTRVCVTAAVYCEDEGTAAHAMEVLARAAAGLMLATGVPVEVSMCPAIEEDVDHDA